MRFPPEFIERLRFHLPLSQVIGKRIAVRKAGREFHALCPFHQEKTPSFTINDEKGFYHCFGCAAHGDAIGFLREYERLSYPEAVERLAQESGMPMPVMSREADAAYKRAVSLQDVCEEAAQWFQRQWTTAEAEEAREYLASRGVSREMLAQFRVGYAPAQRDALKQYFLKKNIPEKLLLDNGLIIKPDNGATYDRFRARIMFPICTASGRVIAFGGRIMPSAAAQGAGPKYLNSPETELFKKGELVYGFNHARRAIAEKQSAVVTEGYLDVIALHQAGFAQAVAPLGTAVTPSHLQLLWRIAPEPILCLDGDAAGRRAMLRAAELALPMVKAGNGLKFAILPEGEDADSLIQKRGAASMQRILDGSVSLSETLWQTHAHALGTVTPEQRAMLEAKLMQIAEAITDPNLRAHFRDYFRQQLRQLGRDAANKTYQKQGFQKGGKSKKPGAPEGKAGPAVLALAGQDTGKLALTQLEEQLMAVVINTPEILQQAVIEEDFARLDFTQDWLDNIRRATLELFGCAEGMDHASLCRHLASSGHLEKVERLLKHAAPMAQKSLQSATHHGTDTPGALRMWSQVYDAHHACRLEAEKNRLVEEMQHGLSEERMGQLAELQAHKERTPRVSHFVLPEE